jgi:hypothetical protein
MAGISPAMTQIVEIKVNRHARPCAGHQQGPLGMALFIEFVDFFRILLVNWLRSLPVRPSDGFDLPGRFRSASEVA